MTSTSIQDTVVSEAITLLRRFENRPPEIVFEWSDAETEAKGWAVINSLRGGAAGGGTRMRAGLTRHEVESLAKTMEVKFTISGPPIGGAKSGIAFDPADPRREGVLRRWFAAVSPLLKAYYGTGGDLNVDELADVIPMTEDDGLWHPQEGIVNGHFRPTMRERIQKVGQLRAGVSKIVETPTLTPDPARRYTIADLITGWGVAESVRHYFDLHGGGLSGKRTLIQGWGNVGSAAAYYLAGGGAKVVAIIDRAGGLIAPDGLSFEEVRDLFLGKDRNSLRSSRMIPVAEADEFAWDLGSEIFLPCAASRLIGRNHVDRLLAGKLEVVACGANVPFADEGVFLGPVGRYADSQVAVIPDFIANCGMARVFANLMGKDVEISDQAIFDDVSATVRAAMTACHARSSATIGLSSIALEIALAKLL